MNWFILIVASFFEVVWALSLKQSAGFTRFWPGLVTVVGIVISMGLLAYSTKSLPIGTAYSVWTGLGAVGTSIGGILLFNESKESARLLFIALIIIGIIGLKWVSGNK